MMPSILIDLKRMGRKVQNLFEFGISATKWILIHFSTLLKVIIELTNLSESSSLIKRPPHRMTRYEDGAIVSIKRISKYNQYIITCLYTSLPPLVDPSSSLHIITFNPWGNGSFSRTRDWSADSNISFGGNELWCLSSQYWYSSRAYLSSHSSSYH